MIADDQDDISPPLPPLLPPFLRIDPTEAALREQARGLHELCEALRPDPTVRPAPSSPSPLSPSPSPSPEFRVHKKGAVKALLDRLPGRNRHKGSRDGQILAFGQQHLEGWSVCDLAHFLEAVLAPGAALVPAQLAYLDKTWAQLQEDPRALPALWVCEAGHAEITNRETGRARNQLLLFPVGQPWQFIQPALGKLPLLIDLLRALPAAGWCEATFGFALCVANLCVRHGSDEDVHDLLELLVGAVPAVRGRNVYARQGFAGASELEKEICALFARCWPTMRIFRLSAEVWGSPWWTASFWADRGKKRDQTMGISLIVDLCAQPLRWHALPRPLDGDQAQAILQWVDARALVQQPDDMPRGWFAVLFQMAQIVASPDFFSVLSGLFTEDREAILDDLEIEVGAWLALLDDDDADLSALDVHIRCFFKRLSELGHSDHNAWTIARQVCTALRERFGEDAVFLQVLVRACLHLAVYPSAKASPETVQAAVDTLCEFMPTHLGRRTLRAICLSLPWLAPHHGVQVVQALLRVLKSPGSTLRRTLIQRHSLGQWVLTHLLPRLDPGAEDLAYVRRLLGDASAIEWTRADLGLLLQWCALIDHSPADPQRRRLHEVLPSCADLEQLLPPWVWASPSERALADGMAWVSAMTERRTPRHDQGMPLLLTGLYRLGSLVVRGSQVPGLGWALRERMADLVHAIVTLPWPTRILPGELVMALLLPLAATPGLRRPEARDRAAFLQGLLEACLGRLQGSLSDGSARQCACRQAMAMIQALPLAWGDAILADSPGAVVVQFENDSVDFVKAHEAVALACLSHHLGGSRAETARAELDLRMARATLQGRDDSREDLLMVLVAMERFDINQPGEEDD